MLVIQLINEIHLIIMTKARKIAVSYANNLLFALKKRRYPYFSTHRWITRRESFDSLFS